MSKDKEMEEEIEQQPCKVVMFLESHAESQPGIAMNDLLPFFQSQGFKVLCFESHFTEKQKMLKDYKVTLKAASSIECQDRFKTAIKCTAEEARKQCDGVASNFKAKINLLEALDDNGMQYCGMDVLHRTDDLGSLLAFSGRNVFMASIIEQSCEEGGVLALVGFEHYEAVRSKLMQHGILDVRGYYTPSHPIATLSYHEALYQREIRLGKGAVSEHKDNIVTIDLFKDSTLNVAAIVEEDYSKYLAGQQHESAHPEL